MSHVAPAPPAGHPDPEPEPLDPAAERRRTATLRHARRVADILGRREELSGVVPLADIIHEASTWAA